MDNKFKETDTMPTEGQFVAIYEHGGKIWSDTLCWQNGLLLEYSEEEDDFLNPEYDTEDFFAKLRNVIYIQL